jgi:mersacidin/lichenicidin family type 2 lantibiotic
MSNVDVIRAWKDEAYRSSLSAEQRALLPENPAGMLELSDRDLDIMSGGGTDLALSLGCCPGVTQYYTCLWITVCGWVCTAGGSAYCC